MTGSKIASLKYNVNCVAIALDTIPLIFMLLNATDGIVMYSYKDTKSYGSGGSNTQLIVNGGIDIQPCGATLCFMISMTNPNNYWQNIIMKMDASMIKSFMPPL